MVWRTVTLASRKPGGNPGSSPTRGRRTWASLSEPQLPNLCNGKSISSSQSGCEGKLRKVAAACFGGQGEALECKEQ